MWHGNGMHVYNFTVWVKRTSDNKICIWICIHYSGEFYYSARGALCDTCRCLALHIACIPPFSHRFVPIFMFVEITFALNTLVIKCKIWSTWWIMYIFIGRRHTNQIKHGKLYAKYSHYLARLIHFFYKLGAPTTVCVCNKTSLLYWGYVTKLFAIKKNKWTTYTSSSANTHTAHHAMYSIIIII